jgi:hypothetical protein
LKKSGAKNFCYSGTWVLVLPKPAGSKSLFGSFASGALDQYGFGLNRQIQPKPMKLIAKI